MGNVKSVSYTHLLLINGILFGIFLLAKEFRKGEPGNESGKESGKDDENSCICDTSDL